MNLKFYKLRKCYLLFILSFAISIICNGQQIERKKVFGGYKYTRDSVDLSIKDLSNTLKSNPESFQLIKKARSNRTISFIISGIGGGLTGYALGSSIGEGYVDWTVAGAGLGLFAVSLPIALKSDEQLKQAVDLYNSNLTSTTYQNIEPELKIFTDGRSLGLYLNF